MLNNCYKKPGIGIISDACLIFRAMRLALSGFFLMLMVSLSVVTPTLLSDINFAEIVEEEPGSASNTVSEIVQVHLASTQHANEMIAAGILSAVSKVQFLHYLESYVNPHSKEINLPPPDAMMG